MNKLFAIGTITLLSVCLYSININTVDYKAKFEQWITQYNKNYSPAERAYRQVIYEENLKMIEAHNADPNESYTMGENQFADLTHEEFVEIYLTVKPRKEEIQEEKYIPPKSPNILGVDWSYITKVKNQGQCGGCWAFSAIGAIEGFLRATYVTETYPDLSEQQLIDCDDFSYGCKGGWPYSGIRWVAENQILPESKYPYVGIKQTCASNKGEYYSRGYKKVDPEVLYSALWSQPVSVCVDASNWQFYKSGIFDNCEKNINHGVLAVGYATNYWIVKNSWGTSWGNEGFIKLARSVDNYDTCAISQQAYIAY